MALFLLKHWRWFAWGAALAGVVWFLLLVRHWHADSVLLPTVQKELAAELACEADSACDRRSKALLAKAEQDAALRASEALTAAAKAEEQARRDAAAWRAKYRAALASDPGCADWAAGAVKCPL